MYECVSKYNYVTFLKIYEMDELVLPSSFEKFPIHREAVFFISFLILQIDAVSENENHTPSK